MIADSNLVSVIQNFCSLSTTECPFSFMLFTRHTLPHIYAFVHNVPSPWSIFYLAYCSIYLLWLNSTDTFSMKPAGILITFSVLPKYCGQLLYSTVSKCVLLELIIMAETLIYSSKYLFSLIIYRTPNF